MSTNDFKAHLNAVKGRIDSLTARIRKAKDDASRVALEKELADMMASIGMEYTSNPDLESSGDTTEGTFAGIGSAMLKGIQEATDEVNERLSDKPLDTSTPQPKLPLWERVKAFVSEKKTIILTAVGAVLVFGAGAYYYMLNKNASAVSSVSKMADVEVDVSSTDDGADPTIFVKVGEWFVSAGRYIRDTAISAWVWVKNFFNKKENNIEVIVDATPVAA